MFHQLCHFLLGLFGWHTLTRPLRLRLEREGLAALRTEGKAVVVEKDSFSTITPVVDRYGCLGVVPVFALQKTEIHHFNAELVAAKYMPKREGKTTWKRFFEVAGQKISTALENAFNQRLPETRQEAIEAASQKFQNLKTEFLSQLLEEQSARVRQALVKKITETNRQKIAEVSAEFVTDIISYVIREKQQETSAFGPEALPSGLRYVHQQGTVSVYVIEQMPGQRTVTIGEKTHNLAFPYVVFTVKLTGGRFHFLNAFFRNEALVTNSDMLHRPPFPGANDQHVCLGNGHQQIAGLNEREIVEKAIQIFWGGAFTSEFILHGISYREKNHPFTWQKGLDLR